MDELQTQMNRIEAAWKILAKHDGATKLHGNTWTAYWESCGAWDGNPTPTNLDEWRSMADWFEDAAQAALEALKLLSE